MTAVTEFDTARFLAEGAEFARAIDAPWSDKTTRRVVEAFEECFHTGAVLWKSTDRPGDALYYRFYLAEPYDTVEHALRHGLVQPNAMTRLISHWNERFGPHVSQSCDFDGAKGLTKTWLTFYTKPRVEEVLDDPVLPAWLRARGPALARDVAANVTFGAVDYVKNSINLYWRFEGRLTAARCAEIARALGVEGLDAATVHLINQLVLHSYFGVAATFNLADERIGRAAFYPLGIPDTSSPVLPKRVADFYAAAPCHDTNGMRVLLWSSEPGKGASMKAEQSYCGDLAGLLADWFRRQTGRELPELGR